MTKLVKNLPTCGSCRILILAAWFFSIGGISNNKNTRRHWKIHGRTFIRYPGKNLLHQMAQDLELQPSGAERCAKPTFYHWQPCLAQSYSLAASGGVWGGRSASTIWMTKPVTMWSTRKRVTRIMGNQHSTEHIGVISAAKNNAETNNDSDRRYQLVKLSLRRQQPRSGKV